MQSEWDSVKHLLVLRLAGRQMQAERFRQGSAAERPYSTSLLSCSVSLLVKWGRKPEAPDPFPFRKYKLHRGFAYSPLIWFNHFTCLFNPKGTHSPGYSCGRNTFNSEVGIRQPVLSVVIRGYCTKCLDESEAEAKILSPLNESNPGPFPLPTQGGCRPTSDPWWS